MNRLLTYLILLIIIAGCGDTSKDIVPKSQGVDSLKTINASLVLEKDALLKDIERLDKEVNYWYNQRYDGGDFNKKGIQNPKEYLWNALDKNRELIPMNAVLGGTMHYGHIEILSSKWLIVEYDDGHVMGKAIYEYHLGEGDEVLFKLIRSIENE